MDQLNTTTIYNKGYKLGTVYQVESNLNICPVQLDTSVWTCTSGESISPTQVCDQIEDCEDISDEDSGLCKGGTGKLFWGLITGVLGYWLSGMISIGIIQYLKSNFENGTGFCFDSEGNQLELFAKNKNPSVEVQHNSDTH